MASDSGQSARAVILHLANELSSNEGRELLRAVALAKVAPQPGALHALPTVERTRVGLLASRGLQALDAGLLPQLQGAERVLLGRLLCETVSAALAAEAVEIVDAALAQRAAQNGRVH